MNKLYQKFLTTLNFFFFLIRGKDFDISTDIGRSNRRYKGVLLSTGSSIFHKIITVGTGLISIPLTMNYLGEERFGIWMICTSILAFVAFADLGLGNGLLNLVSKHDGLGERKETKKYVSSVFFVLLGVSLFIGLVMYAIFPYVSWEGLFNVTSDIAIKESATVVTVLTGIIMLNLPLGVVQKIQIGYQNTHINNIWLSFGSILGLIGVLVAIHFKSGLPWLVGSLMGGPVIANFLNGLRLFFYERRDLLPSIRNFRLDLGKEMIGVGFVFFLLQVFSLIANTADNMIIAQMLGASYVAKYAIAKKLFILTQISQHFITPFRPVFNEAMAKKDYKWAKNTLSKILKTSMLVGVICALPILLFGSEIIAFWVNANVAPDFYLLLGLFFWTFLMNYGGSMAVFLSNTQLLHKQLVIVGLASISSPVFGIILCYLYGVEGVIYGVLLGHLIFFVVPAYRIAFGSLDRLIKGKE